MRPSPYRQSSKAIAQRVREARVEMGLSQRDVADRLGLTEAGYGHYERDRQTFSVQQIFMIARILDRPVEWLLGLDTELSEDEGQMLALYRRAACAGLGEVALRTLRAVAGEE